MLSRKPKASALTRIRHTQTHTVPAPGESPVGFASAPYSFLNTVCLSISPPISFFSLSSAFFSDFPHAQSPPSLSHLLSSSLPFNYFLSPWTACPLISPLFRYSSIFLFLVALFSLYCTYLIPPFPSTLSYFVFRLLLFCSVLLLYLCSVK